MRKIYAPLTMGMLETDAVHAQFPNAYSSDIDCHYDY